MEAVFGPSVDEAVLLSPPTQFNGTVCLQFQYRLSHPKIVLRIMTTSSSSSSNSFSSSSAQPLKELNYDMQKNASDWNPYSVQLTGANDGQVQQVAFVAEKIGFTVDLESVAVRKILVSTDPKCQGQGDDHA